MKLQTYSNKRHGRLYRYYDKGETPARYGIARQLEDGTYEFMCDWGKWHKNYGYCWGDPPYHYLNDDQKKLKYPGSFIVNYNKPKSPKPETIR